MILASLCFVQRGQIVAPVTASRVIGQHAIAAFAADEAGTASHRGPVVVGKLWPREGVEGGHDASSSSRARKNGRYLCVSSALTQGPLAYMIQRSSTPGRAPLRRLHKRHGGPP
jgi:hypothetical protein